jgi:hypothetical protein
MRFQLKVAARCVCWIEINHELLTKSLPLSSRNANLSIVLSYEVTFFAFCVFASWLLISSLAVRLRVTTPTTHPQHVPCKRPAPSSHSPHHLRLSHNILYIFQQISRLVI